MFKFSFITPNFSRKKKATVITLVDRVFKICYPEYMDSELLYLRDILICNRYPVQFVIDLIKKRHGKGSKNEGSQLLDFTISNRYISLPYIPILRGKKLNRLY